MKFNVIANRKSTIFIVWQRPDRGQSPAASQSRLGKLLRRQREVRMAALSIPGWKLCFAVPRQSVEYEAPDGLTTSCRVLRWSLVRWPPHLWRPTTSDPKHCHYGQQQQRGTALHHGASAPNSLLLSHTIFLFWPAVCKVREVPFDDHLKNTFSFLTTGQRFIPIHNSTCLLLI